MPVGLSHNNRGLMNSFVAVTSVVAAIGGLVYGYDLGIAGGVTSMEPFLEKFFPKVFREVSDETTEDNMYCEVDNQLLTLFTSSLYLSAMIASLFASGVTRSYGRKVSMVAGGAVFFVGSLLTAAALNLIMLLVGRLLLGVGVGFVTQSVPLYLSEMAPPSLRGAISTIFHLAITIGIVLANFINYGTAKLEGSWGWRISLGLAAAPAAMFTVGALLLPDTPNSLLQRGFPDEARQILARTRGGADVAAEYRSLVEACEARGRVMHPWRAIVQRKHRPQLAFCVLIPLFRQLTGVEGVMFYAPVLFKAMGFGASASLMSAAVTGLVNVLATAVSIFVVDRFGRKVLFLEGGIQIVACQMSIGIMLAMKFGISGIGSLRKAEVDVLLLLVWGYIGAFAWSWGPLAWLVPAEVCPLEIRSAGQAVNVSVNMFFTFVVGQVYLTMLCHMKFTIYFFFAVLVVGMTLFIHFFLPETKGHPIEEINSVWRSHWFWKRYVVAREPREENDVL